MIKTDKPDFFDTYEKSVRPDMIPAEPESPEPADDLFKVEDAPSGAEPETPSPAPISAPALDDAALEKIAEMVAAKLAPQTGGAE